MTPVLQPVLFMSIVFFLSACGGSDNSASGGANSGDDIPAGNSSSTSARFSKDIGKGCDVLTADLVESTFNVPAEMLRQMKVLGCIYTWKDDNQELLARISMLRVHKSDAAAASWFSQVTRNLTVEEVQAQMADVAEQLDQREELKTDGAKALADAILSSAGSDAVVFQSIENVGDEGPRSR